MRRPSIFVNVGIFGLSILVGLVLCEAGVRLVLNPADYLSVDMVTDEVLGAVPTPRTGAGGFDDWGFRNAAVPDTVDIVAIGDSQTYGNTATMDDSWPYVLGRMAGMSVYNMGLGGYGPNQYLHLLKSKALDLKPKMIIVGLSMTDDFDNAFRITYGLDHWAYLRTLGPDEFNVKTWQFEPTVGWFKKTRVWLSLHSVTYQILFHGPLLGRFQGELQMRYAKQLYDTTTSLEVPEKQIKEVFRPEALLNNLNQESKSVREGMRISFDLLRQMDEICRQNGIRFVVVVIPTKEMVFSEYLEHNDAIHLSSVLNRLMANERAARERTFSYLTDASISYVDLLPALKRAAQHQLYNRTATDMHPNRNGYRVYAEAVFEAVR
jgi:hypothetical protein